VSPAEAERLRPLAELTEHNLAGIWQAVLKGEPVDPILAHVALTAWNAAYLLWRELERRAAPAEEPR
jgi:hypothetical protein